MSDSIANQVLGCKIESILEGTVSNGKCRKSNTYSALIWVSSVTCHRRRCDRCLCSTCTSFFSYLSTQWRLISNVCLCDRYRPFWYSSSCYWLDLHHVVFRVCLIQPMMLSNILLKSQHK